MRFKLRRYGINGTKYAAPPGMREVRDPPTRLGAEQRHNAVAGELVDDATVSLHDSRREFGQLGHDLT